MKKRKEFNTLKEYVETAVKEAVMSMGVKYYKYYIGETIGWHIEAESRYRQYPVLGSTFDGFGVSFLKGEIERGNVIIKEKYNVTPRAIQNIISKMPCNLKTKYGYLVFDYNINNKSYKEVTEFIAEQQNLLK